MQHAIQRLGAPRARDRIAPRLRHRAAQGRLGPGRVTPAPPRTPPMTSGATSRPRFWPSHPSRGWGGRRRRPPSRPFRPQQRLPVPRRWAGAMRPSNSGRNWPDGYLGRLLGPPPRPAPPAGRSGGVKTHRAVRKAPSASVSGDNPSSGHHAPHRRGAPSAGPSRTGCSRCSPSPTSSRSTFGP
jgi:hypothetical protein